MNLKDFIADNKAFDERTFGKFVRQRREELGKTVQNPDEEILLRYRYINCYGWNKICALMSVSQRTVHRIHASALKNFVIPS